jgi:antitoxin VapB
MALNIKNTKVERLAAEVAKMAGETKTEAIRRALEDRRARLAVSSTREQRMAEFKELMEREVWSKIPKHLRGKKVTKEERERILSIGPHGFPE